MKDIKFYKQKAIQNENQMYKKYSKIIENNIDNKSKNMIVSDSEPVCYQNNSSELTNKRSASLNNLGSTYTKLDQLFTENSNNNKENYFNENSNLDTINSHLTNFINASSKQQTHSSISSTDEEFNFINAKNELEKLQFQIENEQANSNKRDKIPLNRKLSFVIESSSQLIKNPIDNQFYFNFNMENRGNL
jgi:hypothetical protein